MQAQKNIESISKSSKWEPGGVNSIISPWRWVGEIKETSRKMDLLSLFVTTNVVV